MKKLILVLLGVVVLVVGAALALPFLVPTETYKQEAARQVERITGRPLVIDGPLGFSLLPRVALQAEDVRFGNVAGSAVPDMVRLERLEAELEIWPLLQGTVEVARFVLIEPEIHLEIDAEGRPNWAFGEGDRSVAADEPAAGGDEEAPTATDGEAPAEPGGGAALPITEVKLGDIRLVDGTLTFSDARSGAAERLEAINLALDLPTLQSRLQADGTLDYQGETITVALSADSPMQLAEGGSSPISLAVETAHAAIGFEGLVGASNGSPSATGELDLDVASIRDLAAWLDQPLAVEGDGLRTLRLSGKLDGSATQVALNDLALALDDIEGGGRLVADLGGSVPRLEGRLDLGAVDVNPYLPPAEPGAPTGATTTDAPTDRPAGDAAPDDAARAPEAAPLDEVEAAPQASAAWSDEPIAVPPLGGVEADFELTVASLRVREIQLDRTAVNILAQGQRVVADLSEFALYGGRGSGRVELEVADGAPRIRPELRLEGLQALPFLTDAAGFDRLEGTASAEFALQTRGRSQRELVENLNGAGQATFRDGAIVGMNLAAMVRNVATAFEPGAGEARKTDFSELSGSFDIRRGIVSNDDLWLQAPVLRVGGSGRINLPEQTLDYRFEPKAAKTLEGQGGEREVAGLLVPVMVRGPWDDLSFSPDLSDLARRALEDPEGLKEEIEQQVDDLDDLADDLREQYKDQDTDEILQDLLRQGSGAADEQDNPAGRLLRGLLGD